MRSLWGRRKNGLIAAGYFAKARYRVGVFERNDRVGGAVQTRELVPGSK